MAVADTAVMRGNEMADASGRDDALAERFVFDFLRLDGPSGGRDIAIAPIQIPPIG
jgi:hypothetical protein